MKTIRAWATLSRIHRLRPVSLFSGTHRRKCVPLSLITSLALLASITYAQAPAPNGSASAGSCSTPREYVKVINDGKYDSVGNLFADNATYMGPDGKTRHGSKDIGAFY